VREKSSFWLPLGMMIAFAITCWPSVMPESLKNFSAAYAIAFCAGIYFPARLRWVLPLSTLVLLDIVLNRFYYNVSPFSVYTLFKIIAFAGIIWLGTKFNARNSWFKLLGGGLLGAIIFYLVTNTASWLFDPGYPKTLAGLFQALTTGIPGFPPTWLFLKNTLISGGLFTGLFAGVMKLSEAAEEAQETEPAEENGEEPLPEEA
jgi:hypothetical protein